MKRIAVAQIAMRWSTQENLAAILKTMELAHARGARICGFSELAITGFHRQIAREAVQAPVQAAIEQLQARCAELGMAIAVGAPTFGSGTARYNSHLLIDESGALAAVVSKQGLTEPEATFFERGTHRPVGTLQQMKCSAVICREVGDLDTVSTQLPAGAADLVFVPGALRQDPEKPREDPPEYVRDIARLAAATRAFVVHTNWPNALNRPEESVDGGGSTVAGPGGEVLFRLPQQAAGVGVFDLGARSFEWHPEP
ncbi:carbon-nitrogen hydrolase family protein [Ramlibacter sp. XY19]|uniref:carbon-nitrogen hydrolase family protein n=1 Tax=Ramlibacter paludis TaxID=2908000 RepID=UPI0023D9943C|nr:carbon-nitrogen hydrolase family protein [Ramlibacter paludis]MCG2592898.1 carbon-nitrogen hydrolase family protein [Ramlibacter paludis]